MTDSIGTNSPNGLTHQGVRKMKWGVRKPRPNGVSQEIDAQARKDAEEFVQAKMVRGKGGDARRKLIKATVELKKKNPGYKKAFNHHLGILNAVKDAPKTAVKTSADETIENAGKAPYKETQDPKKQQLAQDLLQSMGID